MLSVFRRFVQQFFYDDEAITLALILTLGFVVVITMGTMLAPILTALVLTFLLQGSVRGLSAKGCPHLLAVWLVFIIFMALFTFVLLGLLPLIWEQVAHFAKELPSMLQEWQNLLMKLPEHYPNLISNTQVELWIHAAQRQIGEWGQRAFSSSLSYVPTLIGILIYLVLVPLLVFFFLKDKNLLLAWFSKRLPKNRRMLRQVGEEMNQQIANYIQGKVIEIIIVGGVSFVSFAYLDLNYAALLAVLVGLSVIVPYIGAAVVTLPVTLIAAFQWGWSQDFFVLMLVYGITQALDGNVLVPLLFSEAVNLHPLAIVTAVLVFGGIWGFWGVFFAIPLATLCKAVMNVWPCHQEAEPTQQSGSD